MKALRLWGFLVLALALAIPAGLSAQGIVSRGAIHGVVQDATGAVVPGAKVSLTSAFGIREATSGSAGEFLFLALEPGKYAVKVEMSGFKTAEAKDITVRLNERAELTITLEPGAITETVEVTGAVIGVDLSTTTSGTTIPSSLFYNAPVSRSITDIPYLSSGVNDSLGVGQANPSISGGTGLENMYIVNGINITGPGHGGIGIYSNVYGSLGSGVQFDFVKEVQVKTSGFEAQYGQALGGVVNMITKSGGNSFHGGGYFYSSPNWLEGGRRQPNAVRFNKGTENHGVTTQDLGGEVGGYLKKDRIFWYGGLNQVWTREFLRAPGNFRATSLGTVKLKNRTLNYSLKFNFNLTANQNHQVETSIFGDPATGALGPQRQTQTRGTGGGALVSDFGTRQFSRLRYGSRNFSLRYNGVLRPAWLMNASFSWAFAKFTEDAFPNIYRVEDRTEATLPSLGGTNIVGDGLPLPTSNRGINEVGGIGFFENSKANNRQYAVNGTNTFHIFGGHQLDYGLLIEDIKFRWFHARSGPDWTVPCFTFTGAPVVLVGGAGPASPDCGRVNFGASTRLRIGGPSGFFLQQTRGAFTGRDGLTNTKYAALYAQDAWEINKWITLKLGLRWEQQKIGGVDLHYTFTGNWAPRAGIIVDPFGKRKTKVFFNFGRFFEKVPQDLAVRSLSEERSYINFRFAVTNPLSANAAFNSATAPTAGCPASTPATLAGLQSCLHNPANWILDQAHNTTRTPIFSGGVTDFVAGTKAQYQDEFVFGIEHEWPGGIITSGRYLDRRIKRIVEDIAACTVGCSNIAVDAFGGDIFQTFLLGNPSASLDVFHNTLCTNGLDPFNENIDPNAGAVFGCGSFEDPAGNDTSFYAPGAGLPGPDGLPDGFPNPIRRYRALEVGIEKRFTKNWQLLANWRVADLFGNYEGLFRNDNGQDDPNITSLFDFPRSSSLGDQFNPGPLPTDRRHIGNFYASYLFDMGLNLGVGWRIQTGYPLDKLGSHPAYLNQGEIPLGGRGSQGHSPITSTMDWHADYTWKVSERYRIKFVADLFNIYNSRRVARVDRNFDTGFLSGVNPPIQPNPDFLKPTIQKTAYQRPFFARLAVRLEF